MKLSNEAKVGGLILVTGALAVAFAWIIGIQNPFNQSVDYYVTYNFAGGIEVGSPVRVSGIKVGKVEKIDFFVPQPTRKERRAPRTRLGRRRGRQRQSDRSLARQDFRPQGRRPGRSQRLAFLHQSGRHHRRALHRGHSRPHEIAAARDPATSSRAWIRHASTS